MKTYATAVWRGGIGNGTGTLSMRSGALANHPFNPSRSRAGTNPEELIAAALASSYSMTLAMLLTQAGFVPARLDTGAEVTLTRSAVDFAITGLRLTLEARIPRLEDAAFQLFAIRAQATCPVLGLCRVTALLEATLLG